jgi:hypothetical protein
VTGRRGPALLALILTAWAAAAHAAIESCTVAGTGWCLARRFPGTAAGGELGFRFGEPLDVDGDGHADVAAGARFELQGTLQNGSAGVWSGATGAELRLWQGDLPDGLFGHWVLPVPDVDGDGLADVVVSAPTARVDGELHGVLVARSPKSGAELWRRSGTAVENFGWDLSPAGDQDGDGRDDLFVGAPSLDSGRVYLASGRDGTILRTYAPPSDARSFGWYVARVPDVDGDHHDDVAVGAPFRADPGGKPVGGAWILSAATGARIREWKGTDPFGDFGEMVASIGDLDGDGTRDLAVGASRTNDRTHALPGEVRVFSGASGDEIRKWTGSQPGELFGRMVVDAGDVDADGVGDVAIGAPWHRRDDAARTGRVEIRSGRSGALVSELVGDEADCWFGWHVRRAPDPDGKGRPALLVGSLRHPADGKKAVGVIDLIVWRGR